MPMSSACVMADGEPWPACLAAYIAGVAAVRRGQTDLARLAYESGAALLPQARDPRLMDLYVGLRQALA